MTSTPPASPVSRRCLARRITATWRRCSCSLSKGAKVNAVASVPTFFPIESPKSGPIALTEMTPLLAAASSAPDRADHGAARRRRRRERQGRSRDDAADARRRDQPPEPCGNPHAAGARRRCDGPEQSWRDRGRLGAQARHCLRGSSCSRSAAPTRTAAAVAMPASAKSTPGPPRNAAWRCSKRRARNSSRAAAASRATTRMPTGLAAGEARLKGLRFDPKASAARVDMLKEGPPPPLLLERMDINVPEIFASTLVALAAEDVPANPVTDMIAANIAATQAIDGSWHLENGIGDRPPSAEGGITRAALCIRSLKVYGSPARAGEMNARIAKARQWLAAARPVTAEDRNMQLLGLHWAGADAATLKKLAARRSSRSSSPTARGASTPGSPPTRTPPGNRLYVLAKAGGDPAERRRVSARRQLSARHPERQRLLAGRPAERRSSRRSSTAASPTAAISGSARGPPAGRRWRWRKRSAAGDAYRSGR